MKQYTKIVIEDGDGEMFCAHPQTKDFSLFIQNARCSEGFNIEVPYAHIERWQHELACIKAEIEAHAEAMAAAAKAREAVPDAK